MSQDDKKRQSKKKKYNGVLVRGLKPEDLKHIDRQKGDRRPEKIRNIIRSDMRRQED